MRAKIIVNPISGHGRRPHNDVTDLKRIFAEDDIECQVICQRIRGQGTLLARQAVAEGFDMVVAMGGDGTINEVVCALVNTNVPLGIVPAGSGNGVARELGIPLNMRDACRTIIHGRTRLVDVGQMNGRFFLGTAGIGYDAMVGKLFEEKWGNRRGLMPYVHAAVLAFFKYRAQPVRLHFEGRQLTVLPLLVTAANVAQFGGGAIIAPEAKPDDGQLDICIIHRLTFFQALYHWPKLFRGRIDRMPQWEMHRTNSLEITAPSPMPVHMDGEPVQESASLKIDLLPNALCVRVPGDENTR